MNLRHRLVPLLACLLLSSAFWMQTRGGKIQYYDRAAGLWHETDVSVTSLPNAADRALLAEHALRHAEQAVLGLV